VTAANVNDITAAKDMPIEAGATYVFDLGGVVTATVFWSQRSSSRLRRPRLGGHCGGRMPLHQGVQTMEVDGEG
jgi:hypothetical protein